MRRFTIGIGIGMVAVGLAFAGRSAVIATSFQAEQNPRVERDGRVTLLVPAYFYPSGSLRADWSRLAQAARSVPLEVILNPASGPGTTRDSTYVAVLDELRRSGARILAYVDSDYGRRPLAAIEKDLRTYLRYYQIDGFFIDQMANKREDVEYYRSIRQLIRRIDPRLKVVGNPGTYTLPEFLDTADTLVTFEGSTRDFAHYDPSALAPWTATQSPRRFAAITYDVRTPTAARDTLTRSIRFGAGSVFITDQKLPNPYLGLPPYWDDQVAAVREMNEQTKPAAAGKSPPRP